MKKKLRPLFSFIIMATIPLAFFSCYPGGVEYYSDTDIIMTNYHEDFDFNANKNYFMPDTVHYAKGDSDDEIDRQFENDILNKIESNMTSLGYTRLADTLHADVYVVATVTSSSYTGIGWIPGGGWWWGGYPGWGGWYPWYPGYGWGYAYSYTTGSLFMEMVQPPKPREDTVKIVWNAAINGLLSTSDANTLDRINRNIDQAFNQPPFAEKK